MRLAIVGATGFVGSELVRQALSRSDVTSVTAIQRRPATDKQPKHAKLKTVVLKDWENYTDEDKKELAGTDAVIWTVAITPSKSKNYPWSEVVKVGQDYPIKCAETLSQAPREGATGPLRFLYISASNAVRSEDQRPWILGDHCVMRGLAEVKLLDIAAASDKKLDVAIAKPGLILPKDPSQVTLSRRIFAGLLTAVVGVPNLPVDVLCTAMLDQVVNGFSKDTLKNSDLIRIGEAARQKL